MSSAAYNNVFSQSISYREDKIIEIGLTGLDVFVGPAINNAFVVYHGIPNFHLLKESIRQAVKRFPSFAGKIITKGGWPFITTLESGLQFSVFETDLGLLDEIPFSNERLIEVDNFLRRNYEDRKQYLVFGLTLLVNFSENSSLFAWTTLHSHTDGSTIFRFLKLVSDIYHSRVNPDSESIDRNGVFSNLSGKANSSMESSIIGNKRDSIFSSPLSVQSSAIITLSHAILRDLRSDSVGLRDKTANILISSLLVKAFSHCRPTSEKITLYRMLDLRRTGIFEPSYSGNAVWSEGTSFRCDQVRDFTLEKIAFHLVEGQRSKANAIRSNLSFLQHELKNRNLDQSGLGFKAYMPRSYVDILRGSGLLLNNLSYFPVEAIDLSEKPVWYDFPVIGAANFASIYPRFFSDEKIFIRLNCSRDSLSRFIVAFYEALGITVF